LWQRAETDKGDVRPEQKGDAPPMPFRKVWIVATATVARMPPAFGATWRQHARSLFVIAINIAISRSWSGHDAPHNATAAPVGGSRGLEFDLQKGSA